MTGPYKACGKQVLRDREHIADATSETYAQIIADALNGEREPVAELPAQSVRFQWGEAKVDPDHIAPFVRPKLGEWSDDNGVIQTAYGDPEPHNVTNHIDGSRSCICGRRWDRDEGDECPGETR